MTSTKKVPAVAVMLWRPGVLRLTLKDPVPLVRNTGPTPLAVPSLLERMTGSEKGTILPLALRALTVMIWAVPAKVWSVPYVQKEPKVSNLEF